MLDLSKPFLIKKSEWANHVGVSLQASRLSGYHPYLFLRGLCLPYLPPAHSQSVPEKPLMSRTLLRLTL